MKRSGGYSLTREEQRKMFLRQKDCCAICKKHKSKTTRKRLVVDHDHKTGKVRKLLCDNCNHAVGFCKENTIILNAAIRYLRKHNKQGLSKMQKNKKHI